VEAAGRDHPDAAVRGWGRGAAVPGRG
jgi:hypothetical protein